LESSNTPECTYQTTLYLNNRHFLDGCDPNSYANVSWVFGQHDRDWTERKVFGKVRFMSAGVSSARESPRSTSRRRSASSRDPDGTYPPAYPPSRYSASFAWSTM
jgi:hypothetical protein